MYQTANNRMYAEAEDKVVKFIKSGGHQFVQVTPVHGNLKSMVPAKVRFISHGTVDVRCKFNNNEEATYRCWQSGVGMSSTERLIEVLGVPQPAPTGDFDAVQDALGTGAPLEVKKVCSIYGDFLISDFLFILGPRFMLEKNQWMSDFVREGHPAIPRAVLPDVGGMLHWGHSIEGDQFFLEDRGRGRWTVSAFRRNWGDWYESDETLVNWLLGVFHGHTASEWMPEWPREHWFEPA